MKRNRFTNALIILFAAVLFFNYSFGGYDLLGLIPFIAAKHSAVNEPVYNGGDIYEIPTEPFSSAAGGAEAQTAAPQTSEPTDFTKTLTLNDPAAFFTCLTEARDNLIPTINLKLTNYNDTDYDIHKFERGKYVLSSEGKSIGRTAYMTYSFDFADSYAITRACDNAALLPRLSDEQQLTIKKLYAIKDLVIKDGMSDYEKELALHDYIVKNYQYDTDAANQEPISDDAAGITGFITTHKGVCEAYSYTFKALCSICGIECHVVTGDLDGVSHAWNVICLDGENYHIDVTSDDPLPDMPQHCFYTYFNLTDAEIAKTHTLDNKWYECTADKYNYFKYNGLIVHDYSGLYDLTIRRLSEGYNTVVFKKQGYTLTMDDISRLLSGKGYTSYTITGDLNDPNGDHEITLQ